jgi:hypothetical protein
MRRRWTRRFALLGLCAGVVVSALAHGDDACTAADLAHVKKEHCRSEAILYRSNGQVINAALVTVVTGWKRSYDVISPILVYYLQVGGNRLIALNSFPLVRSSAPRRIYEQLEYGAEPAGGLARINPNVFYDRLIEQLSGQYCIVYQMKSPFTGEFIDCDGQGAPGGKLGYLPGTVTAREASRKVCNFVANETSQRCENNGVGVLYNSIQREADGHLYYHVVARRRVRAFPELIEKTNYGSSVPVEYEERTYRVDSKSGDLSLLGRTSMLCSTSCKPLPTAN